MVDAWFTTGDCSDCRRRTYCKKMCTARKRRRHALTTNMVLSSMVGMSSRAMETLVDDVVQDAMDGRK